MAHVKGIEELDLHEYPSTFGMCFDQEIYDEEGFGDADDYLRVFGFILASDSDERFVMEYEG